jgi:DNA anti-recombination protein RmuC
MTSSKRVARIEEFLREQNRRTVAHLQRNIEDFERLAARLGNEIRAEEERTRISDPSHVAYSMFAKAARARRENLRRSSDELNLHLKSICAMLDVVPEEQRAA